MVISTVQATLDPTSSPTNWSDVASVNVDTTDTLKYVNQWHFQLLENLKHTQINPTTTITRTTLPKILVPKLIDFTII